MFAYGLMYGCGPIALEVSYPARYARPSPGGLEVCGYVNPFDEESGRSWESSKPS